MNGMAANASLAAVRNNCHLMSMKRDKDRVSIAWRMSDRRGKDLVDDLAIVLADLCNGGGFCSACPADVMASADPLTADAFANAILRAEGWPEPDHEYQWRPLLMKLFIERYGAAVSMADYRA
ncbi:MAG: hypothetical protein ABIS51_12790 [Sphingomonas sp.]